VVLLTLYVVYLGVLFRNASAWRGSRRRTLPPRCRAGRTANRAGRPPARDRRPVRRRRARCCMSPRHPFLESMLARGGARGREPVRAGAMGGAVPFRFRRRCRRSTGHGRVTRAPMALMNMVSSNINQWTVLAAMIPLVYGYFQPAASRRVARFPLRRTSAPGNPAHPAAIRAGDDGAREHGVRLARRERVIRAVAWCSFCSPACAKPWPSPTGSGW